MVRRSCGDALRRSLNATVPLYVEGDGRLREPDLFVQVADACLPLELRSDQGHSSATSLGSRHGAAENCQRRAVRPAALPVSAGMARCRRSTSATDAFNEMLR